jgi:predicted TIM-barrel fold metal-dependent hydrolase
MGNLWWHDWLAIAQYKKNLHGDMAMWQVMAAEKPALFRRYLREIVDNIGPGQTIWSTDGPLFEPLVSNKKYIEIMKSLTTRGSDGIVFSQEEVDAMLGGNAARIFKLK